MKGARFPLRILLIAGQREKADTVEAALTRAGHKIVGVIVPEHDLPAAVQRFQPEALMIAIDAMTRELLRGLRRTYERQPLPVVVFADRSEGEDIRTTIRAGASAYVVDGLKENRVAPVLEAAVTRFLEFQALKSERDEAVAKLDERRAIERAKGILMRRRDLPEDAAYDVLRKMAMNRGRRMIEVAQSIITAEEALAQS